MAKYMDGNGLSHFIEKLKTWASSTFAPKAHTHTAAEAPGSVTGVKGNSESSYRTGNVNLTAANVATAGSGISISGATITNSGVRSVGTGSGKGAISVNTNGTVADAPVKGLEDGYINTHPENGPMILPFVHNDIAFLLSRGGSAVVKKDGEVWDTSITNVFDGSPSYWAITHTGIAEIVFELTLQQVFTWTSTIYVDFGPWWTRSVKIEVMNSNYENDVWTERFNDTNNTKSHVYTTFAHTPVGGTSAGNGFNKIRLTFSDFTHGYSGTMFRISQIGVYNCASSGVRNTYMSRGIDDPVFRSITPNATNTYYLGSSSKTWKGIYGALIGNVTGNVTGNATGYSKGVYPQTVRPTTANTTGYGAQLRYLLATSSMTTGKPTVGDGHILDMEWDNNGHWHGQLAVPTSSAGHVQWRTEAGGTWMAWTNLLDSKDLSSATNSSSETLVATPKAVKAAYDLANSASTTAGQAMSAATGSLVFKVTYSVSGSTVTCAAHVYSAGQEVTSNHADSCFVWSMSLDGGSSWVSLGTGKTKAVTTMTAFGGNVKCDFTPAS